MAEINAWPSLSSCYSASWAVNLVDLWALLILLVKHASVAVFHPGTYQEHLPFAMRSRKATTISLVCMVASLEAFTELQGDYTRDSHVWVLLIYSQERHHAFFSSWRVDELPTHVTTLIVFCDDYYKLLEESLWLKLSYSLSMTVFYEAKHR